MIRVQGVVADISGRHAKDGYTGRCGDFLFQAVEVRIDGFGFPSGVGENRVVDSGEDSLG